MRSKSQQLMNEISAYVDQYYSERHTAPSVNEIAKGVGIAKTTSYRYLVAMNDLGMLRYDGASRTITTRMISKFSESTVPAPVVGAIPCGMPEEEEENIQEYVSFPVSLFGKGEFYILKASGDSMVDAGIEDGDMVVIRKQPEAAVGDIVVALDETGSNTLKKYGGLDPESHSVILLYQNQERYPNKRILVKELTVQGIAQHVIKALYSATFNLPDIQATRREGLTHEVIRLTLPDMWGSEPRSVSRRDGRVDGMREMWKCHTEHGT